MAKGAAKRVIADNKKALSFVWKGSWLTSLFHLTVQLSFPSKRRIFLDDPSRWGIYIISCLAWFLCYRYLEWEGRVVYDSRTKEVISEGAAITQPGLYEYVFDIIYLTWILQVASVLSFYVWLAYLLIPIYTVYKLWTKLLGPWIFGPKDTPSLSQESGSIKKGKKDQLMQRVR
jgi:hypothetical protein